MKVVNTESKELIWMSGEIETPPFSAAARGEAGFRLRELQNGELLSMPHSRPMPVIGGNCHELRVQDVGLTWRVMYHLAPKYVVVLSVFAKKTQTTPDDQIDQCRRALKDFRQQYPDIAGDERTKPRGTRDDR